MLHVMSDHFSFLSAVIKKIGGRNIATNLRNDVVAQIHDYLAARHAIINLRVNLYIRFRLAILFVISWQWLEILRI